MPKRELKHPSQVEAWLPERGPVLGEPGSLILIGSGGLLWHAARSGYPAFRKQHGRRSGHAKSCRRALGLRGHGRQRVREVSRLACQSHALGRVERNAGGLDAARLPQTIWTARGAGSLDGRSAGAQVEARVKFPLSSAASKAPDLFIRLVQRGRPLVDRRGYGRRGSPLSGQGREGHGNKAARRPRGGLRLPQHRFGGQNLHLGYLDQTWCRAIFRRRK